VVPVDEEEMATTWVGAVVGVVVVDWWCFLVLLPVLEPPLWDPPDPDTVPDPVEAVLDTDDVPPV
jgi:hypothetical protein